MMNGLRHADDPGLTAARLACGGAIDAPIRRRSNRKLEQRLALVIRLFWLAMFAALVGRLVLG